MADGASQGRRQRCGPCLVFGGNIVGMERLRRSQEFAACYRSGRVARGRYTVVHVRPNGSEQIRVGFSVGKRVGNAVIRNRVKRRLREIVRHLSEDLRAGHDVVITARMKAANAEYSQLRQDVANAFRRTGVSVEDGRRARRR